MVSIRAPRVPRSPERAGGPDPTFRPPDQNPRRRRATICLEHLPGKRRPRGGTNRAAWMRETGRFEQGSWRFAARGTPPRGGPAASCSRARRPAWAECPSRPGDRPGPCRRKGRWFPLRSRAKKALAPAACEGTRPNRAGFSSLGNRNRRSAGPGGPGTFRPRPRSCFGPAPPCWPGNRPGEPPVPSGPAVRPAEKADLGPSHFDRPLSPPWTPIRRGRCSASSALRRACPSSDGPARSTGPTS